MKINLFEEINRHTFSKKSLGFKSNLKEEFKFFDRGLELPSKNRLLDLATSSKTWNLVLLASLLLGTLLILLGKSLSLQLINKKSYQVLADQNRIRNFTTQPERGVIYDRNNNVLVRNKPAFSIEMNSNLCSLERKNLDLCLNIVDDLSEVLKIDKARVAKELDAGKVYIVLATGLTKDDILPIEANLVLYPSISVSTSPQRDYLYKNAFAHVLGYVGFDDTSLEPIIVGKMGIEEKYNQYLSGVPGNRILQVDSVGKTFTLLSEKSSTPGQDIYLYLDRDLQKKAYELLEKEVKDGKAQGGVVVAQDPQTGGILALVSYPAFDPDKLSSGISYDELSKLNTDNTYPFFNRAISAAYPPGSTFKMVTASAALMEKVVDEHTIVVDHGYIQVGTFIFRNWKLDGHGEVDLKRALQVSNDVYFYTVGGGFGGQKGIGIDKLASWAKSFGYGSKTGIDINGEVSGFMPDGTGREWYLGDTYITSIGQGDVLSTPLQVNSATTYFANGGKIYTPSVVKSIDGIAPVKPEVNASNLIDYKTYNIVREGMKMAVSAGGTAYPLFDFPTRHQGIELGGKTGTSEYKDVNGEDKTHAWFTVFGPYENANIALTVFLEGGGGGSDDAAPIAKELLDVWFGK